MYSLNKLESCSRISALGPVGHRTSHFKRAVCISCRPCVDVHKGEGVRPMWTHVDRGRGVKNVIICGLHKWMAPYLLDNRPTLTLYHFSDIVGTFPSAKAKTVLGYIHALFTSNHCLMSSWFGVSVTAVL